MPEKNFGWPPNSPDLSPIENLWAIMKDRLDDEKIHPKTRNELKNLIQRIYNEISIEIINALIYSFDYRVEMCIDLGGNSISHFLRKHFHSISQQYVVPMEKRPPILTPEINLLIYQENKKHLINGKNFRNNSRDD